MFATNQNGKLCSTEFVAGYRNALLSLQAKPVSHRLTVHLTAADQIVPRRFTLKLENASSWQITFLLSVPARQKTFQKIPVPLR